MPSFIELLVPFSAEKTAQVEIPPAAAIVDITRTLQSLKVPTDSSVVPAALQTAAGKFPGKLGQEIASIMATTLCRQIRIALKPHAGPCEPAEYQWLCAVHTESLWLNVSQKGVLEVIDQTNLGFAQDQAKLWPRFVRLLLDLANERKPLPSPDDLSKAAVDQIRRMTAAGTDSMKLTMEQARQQHPRN